MVYQNKSREKETKKEYYLKNREEILKKNKKYYLENKEEIKKKSKRYRERNREKLREDSKKNYLNRRKLKTKEEKKKTGVKKGQYSGDKHPNWKGGERINKGYYYIHNPKNPMAFKDGYIKRANLIWYKKTGEIIKFPYVLHHINRNKLDDRFENLEKITQGQHINKTINNKK